MGIWLRVGLCLSSVCLWVVQSDLFVLELLGFGFWGFGLFGFSLVILIVCILVAVCAFVFWLSCWTVLCSSVGEFGWVSIV